MTETTFNPPTPARASDWLTRYYFARAAFSILWVAAAVAVGTQMPVVAAVLLVVYPAWDALANLVDARRHGGLRKNFTRMLNVVVSGVVTAAVATPLTINVHAVLACMAHGRCSPEFSSLPRVSAVGRCMALNGP